jgi:hypothetical protein
MSPNLYEVERVEATTRKPFAEAIAAFERKVPAGDVATLARLAQSRAMGAEIEKAVERLVGDVGFMMLAWGDSNPRSKRDVELGRGDSKRRES